MNSNTTIAGEQTEFTVQSEPDQSSAIAGFRYQPETQKLWIQLRSGGKEYPYYNVPPSIVEEFHSADSKGQFYNTTIRDQYPPTPEQSFREDLKITLEAAGIDTSETVRIQMGREVVFKGNLDDLDPKVNKLTKSRLDVLNAILDVAADGESETSSPTSSRGILNIDAGDRRVLRLEQGKVQTNELQPVHEAQQVKKQLDLSESLDAITGELLEQSGDDIQQALEAKNLLEEVLYDDFDWYRDAYNAVATWTEDTANTNPGLQEFVQDFPSSGLGAVVGRLLERQFDPEWEPSSPTVPTAEPPVQVQETPALSQPQPQPPSTHQSKEPVPTATRIPIDAEAKRQLREFDQRLNPGKQNPLRAIADRVVDAVAHPLPEKLTAPVAAIGLKELYDSDLSSTARQWVGSALESMHKAAGLVPENWTERGVDLTKKTLSKIASIPGEVRQRQMADTVVKLAKTFGGLQEDGSGRKVFGVDTGNIKVRVRNTNQYSVSNAAGDEIIRFSQTRSGPKFAKCQPNALEQKELLQAHKHLTPNLDKQSAETIVGKLHNLAPSEKWIEARIEQTQRIVRRIDATLNRATAKGKEIVEGRYYLLQQHTDGTRSVTAKGAEKPALTITPDGELKSSLQPEDFDRLLAKQSQQQKDQTRAGVTRSKGAEL